MLQWSPSAIGFSDLSPGVSFKRVRESLLPYSLDDWADGIPLQNPGAAW
jgi:hypothetical protein